MSLLNYLDYAYEINSATNNPLSNVLNTMKQYTLYIIILSKKYLNDECIIFDKKTLQECLLTPAEAFRCRHLFPKLGDEKALSYISKLSIDKLYSPSNPKLVSVQYELSYNMPELIEIIKADQQFIDDGSGLQTKMISALDMLQTVTPSSNIILQNINDIITIVCRYSQLCNIN